METGAASELESRSRKRIREVDLSAPIEKNSKQLSKPSFQQKLGPSVIAALQACKTRVILSEQKAIEIFQIKLDNDTRNVVERRSAASVARLYGVTEKAIRDIWSGRTWFRELMHLDPRRFKMAERFRRPGRPRKSETQGMRATAETIVLQKARRQETPQFSQAAQTIVARGEKIRTEPKNANALLHHARFSQWNSSSGTEHGAGGPKPAPRPPPPPPPPPLPQLPPPSSRADDPFHDNWPYWPARGEAPRSAA